MKNLKLFNLLGTVQNGIEAIDKFKKFELKTDLILMDYHMPVRDRIKATQEILKLDKLAKVIICSADSDIETKAMETGAKDFISKPFNFELIQKKIANLCFKSYSTKGTSSKIPILS